EGVERGVAGAPGKGDGQGGQRQGRPTAPAARVRLGGGRHSAHGTPGRGGPPNGRGGPHETRILPLIAPSSVSPRRAAYSNVAGLGMVIVSSCCLPWPM